MEVGNKTALGLYAGTGAVSLWQWFYYSPAVMGFIFSLIFIFSIMLTFFE